MSTTVVEIIADGKYRAAQPSQVLIVAGDTIEFSAPEGTLLSLTAETAAILSPKPAGLEVEIAAGSSVSYVFTAPADSAYCCQVLPAGSGVYPIHCPEPGDDPVLVILSSENRDPVLPINH
jgi:hypothetical protein